MPAWLNPLNKMLTTLHRKPFWFRACLVLLIGLLPCLAVAEKVGVEVQAVTFDKTDKGQWRLDARLLFHLSEVATQAVLHGVPLYWQVTVEWRKPRRFFWDKVLLKKNMRLKLQYHALLNQFSIRRDETEPEMFSRLTDALQQMGAVRLMLEQPAHNQLDGTDWLAIKVSFDREALPTPLRPEAWLLKQWDLSSDWSLWPIQK